jgi:hypothetical protein
MTRRHQRLTIRAEIGRLDDVFVFESVNFLAGDGIPYFAEKRRRE